MQQHALAEERAAVAAAAAHCHRQNERDEETFNRPAYGTRPGGEDDDDAHPGGAGTFRDEHEEADDEVNRSGAGAKDKAGASAGGGAARDAASERLPSERRWAGGSDVAFDVTLGWSQEATRPPSDRAPALEQEEAAAAAAAGLLSAIERKNAARKDAELAGAQQALAAAVARARDAEWGLVVDGLEELVVSRRDWPHVTKKNKQNTDAPNALVLATHDCRAPFPSGVCACVVRCACACACVWAC